jgi:electron transport complex protein RnfC
MPKFRFLGNTRIPHLKNTADMKPIRMDAPREVLLPVEQHIGTPAEIVVNVGDEVKVGQLVAKAACTFSSPIYATVSGKVTKIENYLRSNGKSVPAVRIESDGLMIPYENIEAPVLTDFSSFIDAVWNSGVVGLGGAGFPTAAKLEGAKKQKLDTVILNGAECEPYITSDARTMLDDAELLYEGAMLLKRFLPDLQKIYIGIEANKPEAIAKMSELFKADESVEVKKLPTLYPQGAEKVLIRNVTGRTVPIGKYPIDIGVLVMNVTTVAKIALYVKSGMPLVDKCVTVDGSAVREPKNLIVPIGTPISDVLEFAGGTTDELGKVVLGGPMTGFAVKSLDEPIIKTTGAVIAFSKKDSTPMKTTACIHCGKCVDACPHLLNPTAFTKALNIENEEERMQTLKDLCVNLCVECGCCSYVCPANRPLMENNRTAKNALKRYNAARKNLK